MHLFISAFVWKKEKLHWNSYTSFISEVVNIDFRQIWHFDVKGTGWVGLKLSVILRQTVGRFDMWVTPYAKKIEAQVQKWMSYKKNVYMRYVLFYFVI